MSRKNVPTLYENVIDISQDYLGPAGERFMRRQIDTHLGKDPESLTKADIAELVNWIRPTFALLTDDAELIDSFSGRLLLLARNGTSSHSTQRV